MGHAKRMSRKPLNVKLMGILAVLLILFVTTGVAEGTVADVMAGMYTMEGRGIGGVSGVVQTPDGTLFTAFTDGPLGTWVVFIDSQGNETWSFAEGLEDYYIRYRQPAALPNGDFAVFRREKSNESMVIFDKNGQIRGNHLFPPLPYTHMLAVGENVFMLGNQADEDEDGYEVNSQPFLARLNSEAGLLWFREYPHEYTKQWFHKITYAMDSLIISASARHDEEPKRGLLLRVDLDGNVLWTVEFSSELGEVCYINGVCVNEDGTIAVTVDEYGYNDDYHYDVDRLCSVYGLSMDGEVLWRYKLNDGESNIDRILRNGVMARHVVPVQGGFLCAGYMIARECSGLFPIEWLLLLDSEGNARGTGGVVDIRDGRFEVDGMTSGINGKAILYGSYIEGMDILDQWEQGDTPGKPFFAVLDFREMW